MAAAGAAVQPGPPFTPDEARAEVRRFLDAIADGRPILEDHPDPLEYAQRNGLLLLIGPDEERVLGRLARRMPRDMAVAWRDALRGGAASDAFGPLSDAERLDEARVEAELRSGDSHRRRNLLVGAGVLVVVALAAIVGLVVLRDDGTTDDTGEIRFDPTTEPDDTDARTGPPPAVDPTLVARVDRVVAVAPGDGPVDGRIVMDPPATDLPQPPGAIAATLFHYNGTGQVVLVGPPGWLANACVQVSPISPNLRPFETAYHETAPGACPEGVFGRVAEVGCRGDATLMLDLRIPEGEVGLEEGGTASLSAVRVVLLGSAAGYEHISVNGQVAVPAGREVAVPRFGAAAGETVSFDLSAATGAPLVGTCVVA